MTRTQLRLLAVLLATACGDDAAPRESTAAPGTGGATTPPATPPAGPPAATGSTGATEAPDATVPPNAPPDAAVPPNAPTATATWSECFTPAGEVDTCDEHCAQQGGGCRTTCSTGTLTASDQHAASLTWDGPACSCGNPRCPAPDRATGLGSTCNAPGFVTDGNALPRTSVRCCCQAGASNLEPAACDDITAGVWIKQPVPDPMCATDGVAGYEELSFEPPAPDGSWAAQWVCFGGELVARSTGVYELGENGCSGTVWGASFEVVGDTLTLHSSPARTFQHAPQAPKRPR